MSNPEVSFEVLASGDYTGLSRPILVAARDHRALHDFRKWAKLAPADVVCAACHKHRAKDLAADDPRKVVVMTYGWYDNPGAVEFMAKWVESEGHTFANYAPSAESLHVPISPEPWWLRREVLRNAAFALMIVCLFVLVREYFRDQETAGWFVASMGWFFAMMALSGRERGES